MYVHMWISNERAIYRMFKFTKCHIFVHSEMKSILKISTIPNSCFFRYENGEKAQYHFKSSRHMYNVKDKYRCYFCNSYVQDTKGHLESQHRDMTFKCLLRGCAQPRFTQANKVIDLVTVFVTVSNGFNDF